MLFREWLTPVGCTCSATITATCRNLHLVERSNHKRKKSDDDGGKVKVKEQKMTTAETQGMEKVEEEIADHALLLAVTNVLSGKGDQN